MATINPGRKDFDLHIPDHSALREANAKTQGKNLESRTKAEP